MTAIIIEDEIPAAIRLEKLLKEKGFIVLAAIQSVRKAKQWLSENKHPEIIFVDVQLRDGTCFEIFEKIEIQSKIVFTTAYNNFAIEAFNYNSIAYLLKPIDENKLDKLITKIEILIKGFHSQINWKQYSDLPPTFKNSFLVSVGNSIKKIETSDVICFYSEANSTYILSADVRCYPINSSLDKLEEELNSELFFRVSRKFIVNRNFISSITNSTREINLTQQIPFSILISTKRYKLFLDWFKK